MTTTSTSESLPRLRSLPTSSHRDYNVEGYHTFLPVGPSDKLKTAMYHMMVVVRSELAAVTKIRPDLMHPTVQSLWIQIDLGNRFLVGGLYREWSDLPQEYAASTMVKTQKEAAAAEVENIIFTGDINLDAARGADKKYGRRCLLLTHDNMMAEANMRYLTAGVTYRLHGHHEREEGEARAHESVLDQIYVARDLEATVAVLSDSTTDHYPVVAAVKVNKVTPTLKIMKRRNFKGLERPALLPALDAWPWADVYGIRDPDKVLDFVIRGIVNGLDQAAPVKSITVRKGSLPIYLRPDTLALMAKRDSLGCGPDRYKAVRNRVTTMVRRDKEASNLAKLVESGNSPAVLWEIANAAVGKPCHPLPTSLTWADCMQTEGNLETANTINGYYVQKVLRIWAGRGVQNTTQMTSTTSRDGDRRGKNTFAFGFSSAGRIAKIFSGLKSTSALGTDGIPVFVLKMGSDILAGPVSHLVNMSLLAGVFPSAFKTALIHPVYKGGGKARSDPGSYRPVAILCARSNVLETVGKEDLEAHMKKHDILPT
jgi:endonuclease/exonuclease/phosphatase family metal-dependent hydrolase